MEALSSPLPRSPRVVGYDVRQMRLVRALLSRYQFREKVEGLLSRLKFSWHEAPEEMEALVSLWKELYGVKAYFISCNLPMLMLESEWFRNMLRGLRKLKSCLSVWELAVKALLSERDSKFALSESVKQAENLVSKFRVWITNSVKGLVSLFEKIRFNLKQTRKPSCLKGTVANDCVEVRLEGVHGGGGREEIMGRGRVVLAIRGIINRARNKRIGGGTGGEGNRDEDRGRGRDVDRRGKGNSSPKMYSSRKAEIYIFRLCDLAPHIRLHTIPFGISQASGSGSPVEGQGESSGGQDGGSGARSQGEGSDGGIGGEGDGDEGIGGGIGGGRVVSAIPSIINRARNKGIGGGTGGEGNGDEDRGRGRDVEDRRGEGNSSPKMDSSRKAEIYTDRDCDPAPHIRGPTISFGISQASGSGSPVEGQGESSGGQDGGSGARSQGEGSDRGIGEERDRDAEIGGGIGGGGQGEGNGDEGGNEGRGRVGDVENRREARNARLTRLAEIFIAINVQSTAAAIALHFLGLSSGDRGLLVSVLATNLVGFVCCTAALWQSHTSPTASGILARIGSAATSLGFILMITMILPPYLLWMIVLACLALFAVFILSFMP